MKHHPSYRALARLRWRRIEWISGDGPFALAAHCRPLTVTLWPTRELAETERVFIDDTGCGHPCHKRNHEIVDLRQ